MLAAVAVAVGMAAAAPTDAQEYPDYRFDIGVFGGGSWYSAMLGDDHLADDTDGVRYKAGWVTGLQATLWATPRIGIRANGAYSERPIDGGLESQQVVEDNLLEDINLWSLSGDLLLRPLAEPYSAFGTESRPYIALGIGAKRVNPAGDLDIAAGGEDLTGVYFEPEPGNGFFVIEEWKLMGLAALGTDFRLSNNVGLRLEFGDRFWDSALRDADVIAQDPEEDVGKVVHELYGQLGLHLLLGLAQPEVVAVAPAPPPPPAPEPEPEPEPVEESITVCVIDPDAPGGIRTVNAVYMPDTGDTMVVVNGQRQAFSTTLPDVMLANEADWFVRGEPLAVTLAPDLTVEYTTWQSARMIEASELTYLGTVRGVPVYASTQDVSAIRSQLDQARSTAGTSDLGQIIGQNQQLRSGIEGVQYLYVPLRPTGCIFQTVQQVEQVRKKEN
jgi:opacity protein-like surface antigen